MRRLCYCVVTLLAVALPREAAAGANQSAIIVASAGQWTAAVNCTSLQQSGSWWSWLQTEYPSPGGNANYVAFYLADWYDRTPIRTVGVEFGVHYGSAIEIISWNPCGDLDLPYENWPASGTGDAVLWWDAIVQKNVLVGWFRVAVAPGLPEQEYLFEAAVNPMSGQVLVMDDQQQLDNVWLGWFSTASLYANPVAVRSQTWGRIKAQYRQ